MDLLTINDVCRALGGVCRKTVYNMHDAGKLSFVKVGRRTMVERAEIERFVSANRVTVAEPVTEPEIRRVKKVKLHQTVAAE